MEIEYAQLEPKTSEIRGIRVNFGTTEDGKFIAISAREPAFCLVAETRQDVEDKARAAIDFYHDGMDRW